MNALERIRGRLVVSCQAEEDTPFCQPESMARFALAAVEGGAAGIRANGAADVRAIRQAVEVPIIGIAKRRMPDGEILITPDFDSARDLVAAGAHLVALDCTARGRRLGALDRLARIRAELGVPALADIATEEEAVAAAAAGADAVLSTLRGYTSDTREVQAFDASFLERLRLTVPVPVIAEGRINTPAEARRALEAGAWAVVVGTAITRPHVITRWFVRAMETARPLLEAACVIAIDLGGTRAKAGLVTPRGEILESWSAPTPARHGREALLALLAAMAREGQTRAAARELIPGAVGVATAGWVDPDRGVVVYATDNLPGWTGADIAGAISAATGLPVRVENDVNALAIGEARFGAARGVDDFICLTLGTGVGGGCYAGGRLIRGRNFFANALGHVVVDPAGRPCTCGHRGCLEAYANAAALLSYAGAAYASAEEVIAAANRGDARARQAVQTLAGWLAVGCASAIHLLDPKLLVVGGGLAEANPLLFEELRCRLASLVMSWELRALDVRPSTLGYLAGVLGAAAVAWQVSELELRAG